MHETIQTRTIWNGDKSRKSSGETVLYVPVEMCYILCTTIRLASSNDRFCLIVNKNLNKFLEVAKSYQDCKSLSIDIAVSRGNLI